MDFDKISASRRGQIVAALVGILAILVIYFDLLPPAFQPYLPILYVLAAVFFLTVAGRFIFLKRPSPSTHEPAPKKDPAEQAYAYFASRYGIGYDSIQVAWKINQDGSATLTRTIKIDAFAKIEDLDTYLLIPESSEERQIDFVAVESLTPGRTVSMSDIKKELGRLSALTTISPPLNRGEKIQYCMREKLPVGLYAIDLTTQELSQREASFDYCGWNINRPTRNIRLQVEFPPFFKPTIYSSEVRYASASGFASVRTHYEEEQLWAPQLVLGPAGDRLILKLEVDYPMLGLIYVLRWRPPAKDDSGPANPERTHAEPNPAYPTAVRTLLIDRFDEGELRTLAADLGIDYDNLPDQGKANKARELVAFLERRGQLSNLIELGKQQRPDITWPEMPN